MVHHSGSIQSFKQQKGMHTSISEILKEKSLKPSRRSLPCLAQSQTHPINLNHFLSVPLSPDPKPDLDDLSQSISTSCSLLPPQTDLCHALLLQGKKQSDASGLLFRDGKKRIDYILVYKKSSPQVEKRCTFEKNLRAEGLMLEKEVNISGSDLVTCWREAEGNVSYDWMLLESELALFHLRRLWQFITPAVFCQFIKLNA
uniref:Anoctamin dimerisation domain-containing protein n=1 Tax=Poecilia mexicana TaxID=48701 RepID=A0A3B3XY04_9TELE